MPSKKSNPKKKAPKRLEREFSSDDDDVEIEIPEIEEEEDEGSGDRHPDDTCQPVKADEKAEGSKTKQRAIPGGSRPSPTPSAVKSTKADKELVKSPVPYWNDPKYWIPVLGIIQMHVSLEIKFFWIFNSAWFSIVCNCVMLKVGMATNNQLTGYSIGKYVNGY